MGGRNNQPKSGRIVRILLGETGAQGDDDEAHGGHFALMTGRIGAQGQELAPLDEVGLQALAERIATGAYGAVAIGFIHSYLNPAHERRAREIIAAVCDLPISISSDVSPQMRQRLQGAGMDGFLAKPLTAENVAAALAQHLPPTSSLVQDRHYA